MNDLLRKFENIMVLKTMMNQTDLNFLDTRKLDEIADTAYELDIDLNYIDYEKIEYESQYDLMIDVFEDWFNDVNEMYLDIKERLDEN